VRTYQNVGDNTCSLESTRLQQVIPILQCHHLLFGSHLELTSWPNFGQNLGIFKQQAGVIGKQPKRGKRSTETACGIQKLS
jgi:hypothetical protein